MAADETVLPVIGLKFTVPASLAIWDTPSDQSIKVGYRVNLVGAGKGTIVGLRVFPGRSDAHGSVLLKDDYLAALKASGIKFSLAPSLTVDETMIKFLGHDCYRARARPVDTKVGPHIRATELVLFVEGLWYVFVMRTNAPGEYWPEDNQVIKPFLQSLEFIQKTNEPNKPMEPMARTVTPRADARVAPVLAMAHH